MCLTGQDQPLGKVVGFQHVIGLHLDLAAEHGGGTGPAVALAAGERGLDAHLEKDVEQLVPAGPGHGVGLTVEMDDGGGRRLGTRHGGISPFDN